MIVTITNTKTKKNKIRLGCNKVEENKTHYIVSEGNHVEDYLKTEYFVSAN